MDMYTHMVEPCRVDLVVSVSASHTVGREFAYRPGHTKHHYKNGTAWLPVWHAMQPNCLKGWLCVELSMGTCTKKISWDQS